MKMLTVALVASLLTYGATSLAAVGSPGSSATPEARRYVLTLNDQVDIQRLDLRCQLQRDAGIYNFTCSRLSIWGNTAAGPRAFMSAKRDTYTVFGTVAGQPKGCVRQVLPLPGICEVPRNP
jgi:hypothetical protein